jgi:hypothetical protein
MSERAQRRTFALVAWLAIGLVVLFLVVGPRSDDDGASPADGPGAGEPTVVAADSGARAPARETTAVTVSEDTPDEPGDAEIAEPRPVDEIEDSTGSARVAPAVEAVSRSFLAAYLRYEVGDAPGVVRRGLRASATPALARFLLSQEPRQPLGVKQHPKPGRLVALAPLQNPQDPSRRKVVATIERDERPSSLQLELEQREGAWLVSELG